MASRGDIFTAPVEFGDARNITKSSGAADRAPIWSPEGDKIAWFSDSNGKKWALAGSRFNCKMVGSSHSAIWFVLHPAKKKTRKVKISQKS